MTGHVCTPPEDDEIRHGARWRCPTCRALHVFIDARSTERGQRVRGWLDPS